MPIYFFHRACDIFAAVLNGVGHIFPVGLDPLKADVPRGERMLDLRQRGLRSERTDPEQEPVFEFQF